MSTILFPEGLSGHRILCIGDVMLDHFHSGEVARISPEAPVPVLKLTDTITMPGGAANTARNIAALGAGVTLVAPLGRDGAGADLRKALETEWQIDLRTAEDERGTILKARYSAAGQQLLRIDREDLRPLAETTRTALLDLALGAITAADVVVLSDYAKGALDPELCQSVIGAARARGIAVIVDPKGRDFGKYRGATLITPNELELATVLGAMPADDADIIAQASALARGHDFAAIAVTRGKTGVTLVAPNGLVEHIPSFALDVFDVSGAGDSFVAGLACAIAAGQSAAEAVRYGNAVAGVAVGKEGTAVVSPREVELLIRERGREDLSRIIRDYAEAGEIVANWRARGAKVGFTNGVFDLLHLGHLRSLQTARQHCDKLVVGINADASVKRLKGDSRPIQNDEIRGGVLASLKMVDLVVVFDEDTPYEVIRACAPDILVKGGDYRAEEVVGGDIVTARGGKVIIVPTLHGYSTTATIALMNRGKE